MRTETEGRRRKCENETMKEEKEEKKEKERKREEKKENKTQEIICNCVRKKKSHKKKQGRNSIFNKKYIYKRVSERRRKRKK